MDMVLAAFLKQQYEEGMALAEASDLLELCPLPGDPPDRYLVRLHCKSLVKTASGIEEANRFELGIRFHDGYLRHTDSVRVVSWLGPSNVYHPNVLPPWCCVGALPPGTPLIDILYQVYDIVVYHKWASHDGLNPEACQWARNHQERFPVDGRPLKRRRLNLNVRIGQ